MSTSRAPGGEPASDDLPLRRFDIDPERGFLPACDPLQQLPAEFAPWEEVASALPKLLAAERLQPVLDHLPVLDPSSLRGPQLNRAMLLLSFLGHGYVWEKWRETARDRLPASIAIPWEQVARQLGRPPVLSYASYALDNWRRLDQRQPIALGNLAVLQNFLGGLDEEWFIAIHVAIEATAGPALVAIVQAQRGAARDEAELVTASLRTIAATLGAMYAILFRLPENCDPYIYYHRVRPYIQGFSEHPVIYTGVAAYQGQSQSFFGETGAQSTIIPALDEALGIDHAADQLRRYLVQMRAYMPPGHRAFLEAVSAGPAIRDYVTRRLGPGTPAVALYNECVQLVHRFRAKHLEYAAIYIQKQSPRSAYNSTFYGTGGTPFMRYLKKHRDETARAILPE